MTTRSKSAVHHMAKGGSHSHLLNRAVLFWRKSYITICYIFTISVTSRGRRGLVGVIVPVDSQGALSCEGVNPKHCIKFNGGSDGEMWGCMFLTRHCSKGHVIVKGGGV